MDGSEDVRVSQEYSKTKLWNLRQIIRRLFLDH